MDLILFAVAGKEREKLLQSISQVYSTLGIEGSIKTTEDVDVMLRHGVRVIPSILINQEELINLEFANQQYLITVFAQASMHKAV